jgi:glycosyltransferase involved in cell wall biosynthesis
MVGRDLLVFPLLDEGMPLVLMQAIQVGLPVIASDIEPVRELAFEGADLPLPGDERSWKGALIKVLKEGPPEVMFVPEKVPGVKKCLTRFHPFIRGQ